MHTSMSSIFNSSSFKPEGNVTTNVSYSEEIEFYNSADLGDLLRMMKANVRI